MGRGAVRPRRRDGIGAPPQPTGLDPVIRGATAVGSSAIRRLTDAGARGSISDSIIGGEVEVSDYALRLGDVEVARLQAMASWAHHAESELWRLAGITAGARVADIGCGPGATLRTIADLVGPTGAVIGVDTDAQAIDHATAMISQAGLVHASVQRARAEATGLPACSYDVVMLRHVLAHNGGREQAIVEHLTTLIRPGGCLYLADTEFSAIRVRPAVAEYIEMNERYLAFHTARGNDLHVGLRLAELLSAAGLEVVLYRGLFSIEVWRPGWRGSAWAAREAMLAAGFATRDDLTRWHQALTRLDTVPQRPTTFVPIFLAIGRKAIPHREPSSRDNLG